MFCGAKPQQVGGKSRRMIREQVLEGSSADLAGLVPEAKASFLEARSKLGLELIGSLLDQYDIVASRKTALGHVFGKPAREIMSFIICRVAAPDLRAEG